MFNSYHADNHSNNININAVTGAILKNHPKSWFERFHLKSNRASQLLTEGGHKWDSRGWGENPGKDIIILQMVICGDMEVMAELIYRKDYEDSDTTEKGDNN